MQNNSTNDDVIEIDLQELAGLLLHRLWLLAIFGIAGGAAAFLISFFLITPLYESTTSIYILNKNEGSTVTYTDLQLGSVLTKDYARLIKSRDVLESVIAECGLEESYGSLKDRVEVETQSDTRIVDITVTDEDPLRAQTLADEVRMQASELIREVTEIQAVNVVDEANLPEGPASPSVPKWSLLGAALGILLSALVVVVRFLLDDTVKTSDDIERYLELSTLALIPTYEEDTGKNQRHRRHTPEIGGTEGVSEEYPAGEQEPGEQEPAEKETGGAAFGAQESDGREAVIHKPGGQETDAREFGDREPEEQKYEEKEFDIVEAVNEEPAERKFQVNHLELEELDLEEEGTTASGYSHPEYRRPAGTSKPQSRRNGKRRRQ